jgi:hypothetical protein
MPRPYTQLILVNVLLAALFSITVLGSPTLPAVAGAVGAGAMLYTRRRRRERSLPPVPAMGHEIAKAPGGEPPLPIGPARIEQAGTVALSQNRCEP